MRKGFLDGVGERRRWRIVFRRIICRRGRQFAIQSIKYKRSYQCKGDNGGGDFLHFSCFSGAAKIRDESIFPGTSMLKQVELQ